MRRFEETEKNDPKIFHSFLTRWRPKQISQKIEVNDFLETFYFEEFFSFDSKLTSGEIIYPWFEWSLVEQENPGLILVLSNGSARFLSFDKI